MTGIAQREHPRHAATARSTSESTIAVELDLDGTGVSAISTGVGFYDHMLTALSKHSLIDLRVEASGDVHIDGHHVVEDTAIVIGQALREALGDKAGIRRFASGKYPLDEALDIVKMLATAGFDETVEVVVRLGVDPRKADQMVRGTVNLPNGGSVTYTATCNAGRCRCASP